jgi:hypothetical protein
MLREIVRPSSEEYILKIPKEYINQNVEILVLPFDNIKDSKKNQNISFDTIEKSFGILKDKEIEPLSWQQKVRSEWD